MKNMRVATQLALGFSVMVLLVIACSALIWMETVQSEERAKLDQRSGAGTVALAEAQSTVWALRWGLAQFMVEEEGARKKILEDEPKLYAKVRDALKVYLDSNPTAEEKSAVKVFEEAYGRYVASRPKWFELYGAGKLEEAKEFRAANTTRYGRETVAALAEMMAVQQKASLAGHAEGLADLQSMRKILLGVALAAVVIGAALSLGIIAGLRRQLGGEPAYAKEVVARIAAGDLASQVAVREGDRGSLLWEVRSMRDQLRELVGEVASGARAVADTSAQIAQGNTDLSQRTEEQASTLEETASSMEELTSTVNQNAENARQASELAVAASDVASRGGAAVGQVVATMTAISDSSRKIADIIGVIDGIAFQTNILALNAAVEAARAGEQGRGFAVVATEVRNLAQRSAAAAKEIKELIGNSEEKVSAGTRQVDAAGRTMEEIVSSVKRVSDLIAEIAAASREQSSGIGQVNNAVGQMDQVVQQNASLVEEAGAATESMKGQSESLLQLISRFNVGSGSAPHAPAPAPQRAMIAPIVYKRRAEPAPALAQPAPMHGATGKGEWQTF